MEQRRRFRMIVPRFPLFNIYTSLANKTTALGPLSVATAVSKLPGWDVEVIDENNYWKPGPCTADGLPDHAAMQDMRPADVVGFYGGMSSTIPRLFAIARQYRSWGVPTIGGGQHLDALPDEALAGGIDVVVHGEGEDAIAELLRAWENDESWGTVAGVSILADGRPLHTAARPIRQDCAPLPDPDFGLLRYVRMAIFPLTRTRGCGMACEFCTVRGKPRSSSPQRLLAQVSMLVESYGARELFVVDDHFAQDRQGSIAFCRLLSEYQRRMGIRLDVTVQIRLDSADDEELLEAMYAAGVRIVAVGLESPIDSELASMHKHLKSERMVDLVRRFHRAGLLVHAMFIFGYPMQSGVSFNMGWRERVRRFRRFIRRSGVDTIQIMLPVPLPGTQFRDRLAAAGRLLTGEGIGWEHHDGTYPLIVPDAPMTPGDLHRAQLALMCGFYRLRRFVGLFGGLVGLPFSLLPLPGLRLRWQRWRRRWRNDLIATGGALVVRRWRRAFRGSLFEARLRQIDLDGGCQLVKVAP